MASFLYPYSGFKVLELQQQNTNSQNGCKESTLYTHLYTANSGCGSAAGSIAVAPGDHVVSPFAANCRAPALVLQREARTCRQLSNPDLPSPAVSSD